MDHPNWSGDKSKEPTNNSGVAINPNIRRITALTPMRTDSLEMVRRNMPANRMAATQPDLRDSEAKETNSPEAQTEVESDESRNLLLLKASFMAWTPGNKLSTTALIKSSIARIFLRKERAVARAVSAGAPAEASPKVMSVKARGVTPPEKLEPVAGDLVDALDVHFKWYRSEVVRVTQPHGRTVGSALVRFGDLPDRFNCWIPFNSGRLAPVGLMTSACQQECSSSKAGMDISCGTTALILEGTVVEVYSRQLRSWTRGQVDSVSDDGEEVSVKLAPDDEMIDVVVNDGILRMFIEEPKPAAGKHRRSYSRGAEMLAVQNHTLTVDINKGRRANMGYGEEWVNFRVHDRYSNPVFLGKGAYGCVISADDSVDNEKVAVKKISGIRDMDHIDSMRTLREIKICRHLRDHDNIVKLLNVIPQEAPGPTSEIYLIFEYMPSDLSKFIRSGELADLPLDQQGQLAQGFMYQMLCALKYIHSAGIMHRDIKPSNILVSKEGDLKLADFGLAIGAAGSSHKLISYVVTRWYRAPELLLDLKDYTASIDLWAVGCIFAEMFSYKPRFPGKSSRHQLQLVLQILGKPTEEDITGMSNPKFYELLRAMDPREPVAWSRLYPHQTDVQLDLLESLLRLNPKKRLNVDDALSHPYFNDLRIDESGIDEPDCETLFPFVTEDLTTTQIDLLMKEEISSVKQSHQ